MRPVGGPGEQYADTGGFTDLVFAITALLAYRFIPRIRDLPSMHLHGLREALACAFGDEVTLDFGEQRKQSGHDLGLDVLLALETNALLDRNDRDARLYEAVKDGDDLAQRTPEPGEFADDRAVSAF